MTSPSIAQRITLFSIVIVLAGLLVTLVITISFLYSKSLIQIQAKSQTQIDIIIKSLTEPMWSLDQQAIQVLGDQFALDTNLLELIISYPEGDTPLYRLDRYKKQVATTLVNQPLHYRGEHIGNIRLRLKQDSAWDTVQNEITLTLILVLVLSIILAVALRYSVYRELKRPLDAMGNWADHIALGQYDSPISEIKEYELQKLALQFSYMAHMVKQREESLQTLSNATEQSPACIIITGADERIDYVNAAFEKVMKLERENVIGTPIRSLYGNQQEKIEIWDQVKTQGLWSGDITTNRNDGQQMIQAVTIKSVENNDSQKMYFIVTFTDITQSKLQQNRLEHLALHASLTNLPNRELLKIRFVKATQLSIKNNSLLAVAFLDLDNFKGINDQHGHETGDRLLVQAADRLQNSLHPKDTVARLGGDEFVLLLGSLENIEQCELTLKQLQITLAQPYEIDSKTFSLKCTIGAAIHPKQPCDLDTLIRQADQTMYRAKLAGGNQIQVYSPLDDKRYAQQYALINQLKSALFNGELELFYQPQVNMVRGTLVGAEALIRWRHPEKGLLAPGEFLDSVYGTQIELLLGKWVIDTALGQLGRWQAMGFNTNVSVNVSPNHLQSPKFMEELRRLAQKHSSVDTAQLQFEVLEITSLSDSVYVKEILSKCKQQYGINASLDDFGTGYSSLTHLKDLPANKVKIDREFVMNMQKDENNNAIVHAIIGLSKAFKIDVIAEGVETIEQGSLLIRMGCELAQGYCISKPIPANEFVQWADEFEPVKEWTSFGEVVSIRL